MKKLLLGLFSIFLVAISFLGFNYLKNKINTGAPPYSIEDLNPPEDPLAWLDTWVRPEGPPRVGLQVGHWKNSELPEELGRLIGNTGATGGGKSEWEVNMAIAEKTKEILEQKGIVVDIIPATVPTDYWADVFVAIHADGSTDFRKSGFKVAAPRRDYSGGASELLTFVESEYQKATNLELDPNVTRNMRGYYAFAWWRYDHAVHPKTASVILETGFLTSASDRRIIVNKPEISASGLANGIVSYLESKNLISQN